MFLAPLCILVYGTVLGWITRHWWLYRETLPFLLMCEQISLELSCKLWFEELRLWCNSCVLHTENLSMTHQADQRCLHFGSVGVHIGVEPGQVIQFTEGLCCRPLLLLPLLQRCVWRLPPDPHVLTFVAKDSNGRSLIPAVSNDWWKVWLRQSPTIKPNAEAYFSFY